MRRLWAPEGAEMPLAMWEDGKQQAGRVER